MLVATQCVSNTVVVGPGPIIEQVERSGANFFRQGASLSVILSYTIKVIICDDAFAK